MKNKNFLSQKKHNIQNGNRQAEDEEMTLKNAHHLPKTRGNIYEEALESQRETDDTVEKGLQATDSTVGTRRQVLPASGNRR